MNRNELVKGQRYAYNDHHARSNGRTWWVEGNGNHAYEAEVLDVGPVPTPRQFARRQKPTGVVVRIKHSNGRFGEPVTVQPKDLRCTWDVYVEAYKVFTDREKAHERTEKSNIRFGHKIAEALEQRYPEALYISDYDLAKGEIKIPLDMLADLLGVKA